MALNKKTKFENKKNQGFFCPSIFPKSRKGINVMIGYVLLVTFVIIISFIVFRQLKTYLPTESLDCPDGVSIFIKDYTYNCTGQLNLVLENNGRFDIAGYFIRATNDSLQEVATLNLKQYFEVGQGTESTTGILFTPVEPNGNSFKVNDEKTHFFNFSNAGYGSLYSIEIVPSRWDVINDKKEFLSCSNSKIIQRITCS